MDARSILRGAYENVRLNGFIPHKPTMKQRLFLMMPHKEVLFGGAAGGGKSDALLMSALQYVDVPNYNAILFRKTYTDLSLPDALIPRSQEWLTGRAKWHATKHEWTFPNGAKLAFGYLSDVNQKYRYQGAAFQFIGFDELTQFQESDYIYLHSRLRRLTNTDIPLRIRAATNPGGTGHLWVRKRFQIGMRDGKYVGGSGERPFLPSLLSDNPFLDQESYEDSLNNLDPVTREQLLRGDWGVSADGRFRSGWAKTYSHRGSNWYTLGGQGTGEAVNLDDVQLFMVVDPAASVKEGPSSERIFRKGPSSSVVGLFGRTLKHNHLLWLDCDYGQWELPELFERIGSMFRRWGVDYIGIEANGLGIGIVAWCEAGGYPVKRLSPRSQDKLVRATDACNRMERGMIWFPETAYWLEDCQSQLFTWTGHPHEPDDFVDTLAYAAMEVTEFARDSEHVLRTTDTVQSWIPKAIFPQFTRGNGIVDSWN